VPQADGEQPFVLPENINDIWTKAENHTAHKSMSLRLPITKDSAVFTIEEGIYWNIFARSTLTIDTKTAEISKWEAYGTQNSGRQLRSWISLYAHRRDGRKHRKIHRFSSPASAARF
jgi:hypothetical protein